MVAPPGSSTEAEVDTIRAWFAYLAAARRGYLRALGNLPVAELSRDRGASHPSLGDIFAHSQGALFFWMKDCARFEFPAQDGDSGAPVGIEVLRSDETYLQTQIERVMGDLSAADLGRTVHRKRGVGSPHDCDIPIREVLWHLVEEVLQHHGELNALLWQMDVDAPILSWIDWGHTTGRIQDPPGP